MTGTDTTQDNRRIGLCIDPLDVLFFRDGRPFDAASRAYGGLPLPRTIAGALRTALLQRDGFEMTRLKPRSPDDGGFQQTTRDWLAAQGAPEWILNARLRGPWLALQGLEDRQLIPLLPTPATLLWDSSSKRWCRLCPWRDPLPGWTQHDMLPLWHRDPGDPKHPGGYLSLPGIHAFLSGGNLDEKLDWFDESDLFGYDERTGIRVDAETLTAAEGQIYGARFLSLRQRVKRENDNQEFRVVLYEELILPPEAPPLGASWIDGPVPLGGEGRYARVQSTPCPVDWATPGLPDQAGQSLWLLATPGIFGNFKGDRADRPDVIQPSQLRAAASLHPLAVSGWDIAMNGPRPTRFAVPAGAVYYVEGDFIPPLESLCASAELAAEGWGFALRGVWKQ